MTRASVVAIVAAVVAVVAVRFAPAAPLILLAVALAVTALFRAQGVRAAATVTFLFALGPASVAAGAVAPLSPTFAPLATVALAAPFLLVGGLARFAARGAAGRALLVAAGTWILIEHAWGSTVLLGTWAMPALTLSFAWTQDPFLPWLAPAGPVLGSVITLLAGWALRALALTALRAFGGWRDKGWFREWKVAPIVLLAAIASLAVTVVLASAAAPLAPAGSHTGADALPGATLPVRIVQPATPAPAHAAARLDPETATARAELLTLDLAPWGASDRLLIWPEAALPADWHDPNTSAPPLPLPGQADVLLGAITVRDGRRFNSAVLWRARDARATVVADKRRLVPITETGLHAGRAAPPFAFGGQRIAVLICWEAAFQAAAREAAAAGATVLVILSDDGYAPVGPVPELHLRVARARAAEVGLPTLFVQASGPSAAILADGRLFAYLPPGLPTFLDVDLPVSPAPSHPLRQAAPVGPALATVSLLVGLLPLPALRLPRRVARFRALRGGGPGGRR